MASVLSSKIRLYFPVIYSVALGLVLAAAVAAFVVVPGLTFNQMASGVTILVLAGVSVPASIHAAGFLTRGIGVAFLVSLMAGLIAIGCMFVAVWYEALILGFCTGLFLLCGAAPVTFLLNSGWLPERWLEKMRVL